MRRLLLSAYTTVILIFPVQVLAMPSTKDSVGVLYRKFDRATETVHKSYFKPWGQIVLSKKEKDLVVAECKRMDSKEEVFKIGFLSLVNDQLTAFTLYGSEGSLVIIDVNSLRCHLSLSSPAGVAGIHENPCSKIK